MMSNMAYQTCQQNQMPVRGKRARRGAATLWIILCLPAVLCLIGVVVETGNLLLARIELTNALEAGALSGADVVRFKKPRIFGGLGKLLFLIGILKSSMILVTSAGWVCHMLPYVAIYYSIERSL